MAALNVLAKKLEIKSSEQVLKNDEPFSDGLIFKSQEIKLLAKETSSSSGDLIDSFLKKRRGYLFLVSVHIKVGSMKFQ